jgi:ABC-2 type transport system ATP-binding protein
MLFNFRLPGPFARVPIAWVVAVILFILAWVSEEKSPQQGNVRALVLAVIGVLLVIRGAMVFNQRRQNAALQTMVSAGVPYAAAAASALALATAAPDSPSMGVADSGAPETVIEAKDLTKRYDQLLAVDAVSFTVQRGEIFGLLGPNGAGKSTTLEMLEGLRDMDSGSAIVLGTDIKKDASAVKQRIGVQLQATALPNFITVTESLDLFRAFYDHTRDTAELLEDFDLVAQAKQITSKLSGGQQQRLSIAIAMVNDPDVVFLDEPTTGLDPQARISLWGYIERFRARGKTVMLTTHYMEEAERLCDRVAVMDQGHIVALGTPERLVVEHGPGTTIEFTSPGANAAALRAMTGVDTIDVQGDDVHIVTRTPEAVLAQLLHPEADHATTLTNLRVERGTLEDVFIALTGRELRS